MYSIQHFIQDESELINQLASGSDHAFQVFYERYQSRIYLVALRYLKCESKAEEVVQDVFMKLWLNRTKIHSDRPIEAWLYTVAKNNILNQLKKQAIFWKVLDQLKNKQVFLDNSMEDNMQYADYEKAVNITLKSLSNKQLLVYNMARQENLSYLQISQKLNISPLTVKTHMSRALCHIRSVLSPLIAF